MAAAGTGVSREKALGALRRNSGQDVDPGFNADMAEATLKVVELDGRRSFFRLRDTWSTAIIGWISVLILFNCSITLLTGFGVISFARLEWFVTAVTAETFLQTIGLGYVAARFLFSDGGPSPRSSTRARPPLAS